MEIQFELVLVFDTRNGVGLDLRKYVEQRAHQFTFDWKYHTLAALSAPIPFPVDEPSFWPIQCRERIRQT